MNFKNLEKSDILKIAKKILFSQNFKSLVFFEVGKPGLLPTALKYDIKFHSKPFYLKSIFLHFYPKNCGLKENFSERPLKFCPFNCTYLGKHSFQ